jgi:MFS family permease
MGVWGLGSLLGGIAAARAGRRAPGVGVMVAALAVAHLLLTAVAGSIALIGLVLLLAGATIAPTYSLLYALTDDVTPRDTLTEAFAWLATAAAVGAAAGAAVAGNLSAHGSSAAAFAFAGAAGVLAWLVAVARSHTLVATDASIPALV